MRSLDLQPQKKLRNPGRHIRALERWSRSFAGFFPTREMGHKDLWYERIPVFEKVVAPPRTTLDLQKRCAQLMVDAAERLRDARASDDKETRVYAFLTFPNMFQSFVEVAFGQNPYLFFNSEKRAGRQGDERYWEEYFDIGPGRFHELNLRIPNRFEVLGTGLRRFDADWMSAPIEIEEWAVGELG